MSVRFFYLENIVRYTVGRNQSGKHNAYQPCDDFKASVSYFHPFHFFNLLFVCHGISLIVRLIVVSLYLCLPSTRLSFLHTTYVSSLGAGYR